MDAHFVVVTTVEAEGLRQLLGSELAPPGDCFAAMPGEQLSLDAESARETLPGGPGLDVSQTVVHLTHGELAATIAALESREVSAEATGARDDVLALLRTAHAAGSGILIAHF